MLNQEERGGEIRVLNSSSEQLDITCTFQTTSRNLSHTFGTHHIFNSEESVTYENKLLGSDVPINYLVMIAIGGDCVFSKEIEVDGTDADALVDIASRNEVSVSIDVDIDAPE